MVSAWVITQEGTRHAAEVIGISSARKPDQKVKEYIEWLYALLHCYPEQHLAFARYLNPIIPYEAEYDRTNTGIPVSSLLRCGGNPYLVACLAKNVAMVVGEDVSVLKWTNPDRLICDPKWPHQIVEKISGAKCQAPIRLPLLAHR